MRYLCKESFSGPYGSFSDGFIYDEDRPVVKDWVLAGFFVPVDDDGNEIEKPKPELKPRKRPRKKR